MHSALTLSFGTVGLQAAEALPKLCHAFATHLPARLRAASSLGRRACRGPKEE